MSESIAPSSRHDRIAALLAQIPPDERTLFDAYYQQQLAAATQAAYDASRLDPDTDTIESELVDTLLRQSEGRDSHGVARVPTGPTTTAPILLPDTDPRITPVASRGASDPKRGGWRALPSQQRVLLVAAIALSLWFILPSLFRAMGGGSDPTAEGSAEGTPMATPTGSATVPTPITDVAEAGSDITVAYPSSLEIIREDAAADVYRVQASSSALGGTWTPDVPAGVVAWLNGSYVNYVFCLPSTAAATVADLGRGSRIVMRPANGAVRDFEVLRVRQIERQAVEVFDQRRSGMTLVLCGGDTNQRTVVEAVYRPEPLEQPSVTVGTSVRLADLARLTVSAVRVLPPDDTMPLGFAEAQIEVAVENLTTAPLDEQDLVDQLITAEGLAERIGVLHGTIEPKQSRRLTFRYRIPLGSDSTARWKVTELGGGSIEVGVTLTMPTRTNRSAYTAQLTPADVRIRREERGVTIQLAALITATGSQPSVLQRGDISVWVGDQSVPVTLPDHALPLTVDPLTPTTVRLTAPLPDVSQFEVQIGAQRFRVQLP